MLETSWIVPDWPAPAGVRAAVSTRLGPGVSLPPYDRLNLGSRSGDEPAVVASNRQALQAALGLPTEPCWLQQVHGVSVVDVDAVGDSEPQADAAVTSSRGRPLVILTADCLPVLFASRDGERIAAAHAGWRGLAAGVLESTVAALGGSPDMLMAWLGPCIGPASYEVGEEVRQAFVDRAPAAEACFRATCPGHWLCDLSELARLRLRAMGLRQVHGGGFDTLTDARLYSYRRDGARSGRFASLIWRE